MMTFFETSIDRALSIRYCARRETHVPYALDFGVRLVRDDSERHCV
jgi:hypothetical protein